MVWSSTWYRTETERCAERRRERRERQVPLSCGFLLHLFRSVLSVPMFSGQRQAVIGPPAWTWSERLQFQRSHGDGQRRAGRSRHNSLVSSLCYAAMLSCQRSDPGNHRSHSRHGLRPVSYERWLVTRAVSPFHPYQVICNNNNNVKQKNREGEKP